MFPITISLDDASGKPLYLQLYEVIAEAITTGSLKNGEKLPSKRNLCELLNVSHSTVESAYEMLKAEGYIEAAPKSGYYVAELTLRSEEGAKPPASEPETKTPDRSTAANDLFPIGAVATEQFPYSSWAKLYKEVIYQSRELLEKGDPQGEYALRKELERYLSEYRGVRAQPEQIVIGAGFEYLMERLLIVLADLDSERRPIALEDPGYPAIRRVAESLRLPIIPIPVDRSGMRVQELSKHDPGIVFVTPSHQFPTGSTLPLSRRTALLRWAAETGAYVIEDDYDSDFRYHIRPIRSMQGIDDASRVIYVGSFNRTIAPAIRVAYMILPKQLLPIYMSRLSKQAVTVSRFEQMAIGRLMSSGIYVRHIRRSSNLYRKRGEMVKQTLLNAFPGSFVTGDGAGLHFILHLPDVSEDKLMQEAARSGIILHPVNAYREHSSGLSPELVIGFAGLDEEGCRRSVEQLSLLVSRAKGN